MADLGETRLQTYEDLKRFETERSLSDRLPEQSIWEVFKASAERAPEATAITMLMTGTPEDVPQHVSYRDLFHKIQGAANMFTALAGPAPGVAYMLPSLIETYVTLWAAETAGYAVPINFLLQADSIAALIKASGARILVALGPHPDLDIWEKAQAIQAQIPGLILVQVSPPETPTGPGVVHFGSELGTHPTDHLTFGAARGGDDVAAYFHTGGTTGLPKLVAHTHRGQLVSAFGGAVMCGYTPEDVLTATLPLFHVAGTIVAGLSAFMAGAELVVMSPAGLRNPVVVQNFWRIVAERRVTLVGGVPTAIGAVLQTPVEGHDLSRLRAGLTGAALLPPAISEQFHKVTGKTLFEILGMTETSGLISIDPLCGSGGPGSVGWPLPYTNVEIRQLADDGTLSDTCAPGQIGVITIEGDHISPGYRNPEQNSGTFEDGCLNSGDLGYKDDAGRVYVAGRSKDLIIRSGHNIDPAMIENAMTTHPDVALAAAVGMPDAYAGELPVCFVQLHPGRSVSMEDLVTHAQAHIDERPAWPKQFFVIDAIPLTSVGKIFKPTLRCEAARHRVADLLEQDFEGVSGYIHVEAGGPRGLAVTITLPPEKADIAGRLETALAEYLFEGRVLMSA